MAHTYDRALSVMKYKTKILAMKKLLSLIFATIIFSNYLPAQIESTFNYSTEGQRVCLVDISVDLNLTTATLHFKDAALNNTDETAVYRRQQYGNGMDWVLQVEGIPAGTNSWTDSNVKLGEVWEYQVKRTNANGVAIGYATAAILYDQSDYRGQMILVISNDYANELPDKIWRLKKDLTADGWYVNELVVGNGSIYLDDGESVVGVKDSISTIYNNAPVDDKPKVLFILGSVPLPRLGQGLQPPDGHIQASGARGSDSYYADVDGIFTDTATYDVPQQYYDLLKNYPGDFRWDQDKIPSELEMAFGRVSFLRVASGAFSEELAMMESYLDRLHNFRYVVGSEKIGQKTAFNETGYSNSTDASYRCLPALSGGQNVSHSSIANPDGHNQWTVDNGPFMWYMSNQYLPQLDEWQDIGMDALVYSSDQSNFGYGDVANNSAANNSEESNIRRILSYDTKCLISLWTTSAINVFHQAGIGEPLGYACKFIMDYNTENQNYEKPEQNWDNPDWWNRTHFNFFGDPTLRLYQTIPPSNLQVANTNSEFRLEWNASIDENLLGYHIYKSDSEFGIYQKISGSSPITDLYFTDPFYELNDWYMVRAIAEQTSGSGIFLNPSHGIFVQGDIVLSANMLNTEIEVNIYPNPVQSEMTIETKLKIERIEILDSTGKKLRAMNPPSSSIIRVPIYDLSQGTYLLKINSNGKSMYNYFVKM